MKKPSCKDGFLYFDIFSTVLVGANCVLNELSSFAE